MRVGPELNLKSRLDKKCYNATGAEVIYLKTFDDQLEETGTNQITVF